MLTVGVMCVWCSVVFGVLMNKYKEDTYKDAQNRWSLTNKGTDDLLIEETAKKLTWPIVKN